MFSSRAQSGANGRFKINSTIMPMNRLANSAQTSGPLRSNNLSAVLSACRAGLGLAVLPWYVARESLADGAVVAVLADFALPTQELHAVFPSPKLVPGKVSTFIDFLKIQLDGPWWQRAPGASS